MKSFKKLVGERIRRHRELAGFNTQQALADDLDIDQSRISRWERGENLPSGDLRERLLEALGTTEDEIFGIPTNQLEKSKNLPENLKLSVAQLKQLIEDPADRIPFALIEDLLKRFLAEAPDVRAAVLSVLYGDSSISSLVVGETGKASSQ